jgi:hypothetical protein
MAGECVGTSGVTRVAALEALANYFKHRDEWPHQWEALEERTQKPTAIILKNLGLLEDRDGTVVHSAVLYDGFKLLVGHEQHNHLDKLKASLDNWNDGLRKEYEDEFKKQGLLLP